MKITVVTAVFNREKTIGQAIASVASQSHSDIEHLVIDGVSTDDTLAIVKAQAHERLRLISEPDTGIYDALNKGMKLAQGEVIGLVHSDDWLAHDRVLKRVVEAFEPDVDAVYGDLDYVSATDPRRIIRHWKAGPYRPARLRWGWMPPHPTLFIRRRVFEQWGGYDTRYRIAADYDAILRWFGKGAIKVAYLPEVLVKMRVGGESNRSLERILRKSREDYQALRANRMGGARALVLKNISKVGQFVIKDRRA